MINSRLKPNTFKTPASSYFYPLLSPMGSRLGEKGALLLILAKRSILGPSCCPHTSGLAVLWQTPPGVPSAANVTVLPWPPDLRSKCSSSWLSSWLLASSALLPGPLSTSVPCPPGGWITPGHLPPSPAMRPRPWGPFRSSPLWLWCPVRCNFTPGFPWKLQLPRLPLGSPLELFYLALGITGVLVNWILGRGARKLWFVAFAQLPSCKCSPHAWFQARKIQHWAFTSKLQPGAVYSRTAWECTGRGVSVHPRTLKRRPSPFILSSQLECQLFGAGLHLTAYLPKHFSQWLAGGTQYLWWPITLFSKIATKDFF